MCPTSWLLLESIMIECYQVVIILLVKTDCRDRMVIHPNAVDTFVEVWKLISDL
jgi:hypothetical protein